MVVGNRMDKTVVVELERTVSHPFYSKTLRKKKKVKAHDGKNECGIGDIVRLEETRPLSREKHWMVIEIVKRKE
ncbi:30S ribosomal protein S17 [Candidatus Aerophobetes bacterium]|nr:30S ribosomal protein S17 [Candidatus Aerophobetes bacterium]